LQRSLEIASNTRIRINLSNSPNGRDSIIALTMSLPFPPASAASSTIHRPSSSAAFSPPPKSLPQDSIRFNKQSASNVISRSDLQYGKHDGPRISTPRGTTTLLKSVDINADAGIAQRFDPLIMLTDESNLHDRKQESPKRQILRGVVTQLNRVSKIKPAGSASKLDGYSKTSSLNMRHDPNAPDPILSTDFGIMNRLNF
jgi:hypothetical protein